MIDTLEFIWNSCPKLRWISLFATHGISCDRKRILASTASHRYGAQLIASNVRGTERSKAETCGGQYLLWWEISSVLNGPLANTLRLKEATMTSCVILAGEPES